MKLRTPITLFLLLAVLAGGAYYGWQALTSPTADPTVAEPSTNPDKKSCPPEGSSRVLRADDVRVSVFNASSVDGLAGETMAALNRRGFQLGEVGNAPDSSVVPTVEVRSVDPRSPEARLVARQFGVKATRMSRGDDLGPGVDVFVGSGFDGLVPKARAKLTVKAPAEALPKRCRDGSKQS
ncbi:MAG TPA: LytR C-terminal domain-containing protein [Nocardioidaceae bacterium]|nr:LytR C-terminal domain-containing protein [Nocardioidaceae bacterium]